MNGHATNLQKKSIIAQYLIKYKCQFLAFFHVFDKLFDTIYMIQEFFVESFSKHFVHLLNVRLDSGAVIMLSLIHI